mmetsp:Transcript_5840/g.16478  ORF Transcript_5840/g.16478 Transcript_5840/m.16478 type:complete len:299 (-) Transcript_5840:2405-3301(-)
MPCTKGHDSHEVAVTDNGVVHDQALYPGLACLQPRHPWPDLVDAHGAADIHQEQQRLLRPGQLRRQGKLLVVRVRDFGVHQAELKLTRSVGRPVDGSRCLRNLRRGHVPVPRANVEEQAPAFAAQGHVDLDPAVRLLLDRPPAGACPHSLTHLVGDEAGIVNRPALLQPARGLLAAEIQNALHEGGVGVGRRKGRVAGLELICLAGQRLLATVVESAVVLHIEHDTVLSAPILTRSSTPVLDPLPLRRRHMHDDEHEPAQAVGILIDHLVVRASSSGVVRDRDPEFLGPRDVPAQCPR